MQVSLHTVLPACSQTHKTILTMGTAHRTMLVATSCPNYLLYVIDIMLTWDYASGLPIQPIQISLLHTKRLCVQCQVGIQLFQHSPCELLSKVLRRVARTRLAWNQVMSRALLGSTHARLGLLSLSFCVVWKRSNYLNSIRLWPQDSLWEQHCQASLHRSQDPQTIVNKYHSCTKRKLVHFTS